MHQESNSQRKHLVHQLQQEHRILTKEVEQAFLSVPREYFVLDHQKQYAYMDRPLDIGEHQTISAPHMVAIMVEALDIKKGQKILEIGSGSGYHAAIVSHLVGSKGTVYSVERITSLAAFAKQNLKKAEIKNVTIVVGDGSLGLADFAPYDHIYVTCASPRIPQPLLDQLKIHGSLLIPVGNRICELQKLTKTESTVITKHLGGCAFVPLIGKHGFNR